MNSNRPLPILRALAHGPAPAETMMNFWKTLQNPFALALQGFAIGACLFLAGNPLAGNEGANEQPAAESVLSTITA